MHCVLDFKLPKSAIGPDCFSKFWKDCMIKPRKKNVWYEILDGMGGAYSLL